MGQDLQEQLETKEEKMKNLLAEKLLHIQEQRRETVANDVVQNQMQPRKGWFVTTKFEQMANELSSPLLPEQMNRLSMQVDQKGQLGALKNMPTTESVEKVGDKPFATVSSVDGDD